MTPPTWPRASAPALPCACWRSLPWTWQQFDLMEERLQKILARAGVASRRAAEELILAGRVTGKGPVVPGLCSPAPPDNDAVAGDGVKIKPAQKHHHPLLPHPPPHPP